LIADGAFGAQDGFASERLQVCRVLTSAQRQPDPWSTRIADGPPGLLLAAGPAVGEVVRDLFLGRRPAVDVAPLAADRFQRGTGTARAERGLRLTVVSSCG
jgi:hypothetical protein